MTNYVCRTTRRTADNTPRVNQTERAAKPMAKNEKGKPTWKQILTKVNLCIWANSYLLLTLYRHVFGLLLSSHSPTNYYLYRVSSAIAHIFRHSLNHFSIPTVMHPHSAASAPSTAIATVYRPRADFSIKFQMRNQVVYDKTHEECSNWICRVLSNIKCTFCKFNCFRILWCSRGRCCRQSGEATRW